MDNVDRRVAVVVAVLAVLAAAAALVFWPRPPATKPVISGNASSVNATPASPPRVNVTVRLVAQSVAGPVLVNGSRVELPVTLRVARCSVLNVTQDSWPGWEALNGSLTVRACHNATLRLAWRRIYATVRFEGEGPFQLDGKNMTAPVALKLPLYTVHNVTQLPYRRGAATYTPLNRSLTLNVTGNVTVRLAWEMRCRGVSFRSEPVGVRGLPKCLPVPVTVEFPLEGPAINSTHRYWLAWYWIEENGSKWWWSPGINGSKLRIDKPANVTLHYLPGLKNLPYVVRVYRWPEAYVRAGMRVWVGGGWVRANASKPFTFTSKYGTYDYYDYVVIFSVPGDAGLVEVEAYVPSGNGHITLYYLPWGGFTYAEVVCGKGLEVYSTDSYFDLEKFGFGGNGSGIGLEVHAFAPARMTVLVNTSAFEEVWRRGKCETPVNTLYPYVVINGRRHRWRSDEYYVSDTVLNPVHAIKPLSVFTVYRKPGGRRLILVKYFLWVKDGRPAPFLAVRVKGVAP